MDYEKKYKDALERARQFSEHPLQEDSSNIVEYIFPELRESKDEKIRQNIIAALKGEGYYDCDLTNECIAWLEKQCYTKKDVDDAYLKGICYTKHELEKQGEQKPRYSIGDVLCDKSCTTLNKDTQPNFEIIDIRDGMYICDKGSFPISQQDEYELVAKKIDHKTTDKVVPKFKVKYAGSEYNVFETKDIAGVTFYGIEDEPNHIDYVKAENCDIINGYAIKENGSPYPTKPAVFSEQKTTDKVEPKFHEGEWIVWKDKCYKVNYNGCGYELVDQNGLSTSLEYGTVDTSARLWNITKDVKDGDVLYSLDTYQPFIYKARNIHEQATAYCGINKYGKFFVWNTNDCIITLDKYIPATKEQRDTLLKAMADAGYTFDFDKKELKKIEKKSQRMVSAEAKEALYNKPTDEEMKELLRTEYEKGRADAIVDMYVPTQISPEESLGVSSEKYMDIVDTLTQGGQKPAKWSLGDERVIAIINNALTESNTPPDDYDKVYDWLESLKQRIGG